ncbi:MAG TPA: hypothetical protein DD671_14530 [Balneolaceae bacterium]|nr:hypothetical protein [Balneolaceae bacterium]
MNSKIEFILGVFILSSIFIGCNLIGGKENEEGNTTGTPPPPHHEFPRWSPDGTTILYYSYGLIEYDPANNSALYDTDSTGIWAMNSDGTNHRKIISADYADWSPSGDSIVFSAEGNIYTGRYASGIIDTASIEQLTFEGRNFFPTWSPNGKWIAYRRSLSGESTHIQGIWRMDTKGDNIEQLFSGNSGSPAWNVSGTKLGFFRGVINSSGNVLGDKFWFYTFDNDRLTELVFLKGDNRYPKYSSDGQQIVFESDAHIWRINVLGENLTQLTFEELGRMPDWSPNGKYIVFIGPKGTIWRMDKDGGNQVQLTFRPE